MEIDDFFKSIREKCSSSEEYVAEVLKARGFLLEDNSLVLSDNSHPDDEAYLNEILNRENMGEVKDRKISFLGGNIEKIFTIDSHIGQLVFSNYSRQWGQFINKRYAAKVQVRILEPFVARYIKAISACGVWTDYSCDGNHLTKSLKVVVRTDGVPSITWHRIICQKCLSSRFNLKWDEDFKIIRMTPNNKWKIYIELNRAGEFLYNNRLILRQIKDEALENIINNEIRHPTNEEKTVLFSDSANKLLENCKFIEL